MQGWRDMRVRRSSLTSGAILAAAAVVSCQRAHIPLPALAPATIGDTIGLAVRGEYIVRNVAVCGQCHAENPRRDRDGPLSGGMEFSNWRIGTARASNLTPDSATGLGAWSDAEIVRALRNGQGRDARLLIPVMPYEWFHGMSDRDALAVARYLKSLQAVRNEVRQSPSFWFRLGKLLFLGPKPPISTVAPPHGVTAEYGRYISQHVALCADCHTPRGGIRAAPDRSRLFAGMTDPPAGFPASPSNLTPDSATGIGEWSEQEFLRTLRTGVNPRGDSLHRFMPWREVRRMSDTDLRAIYLYLRSVPPIRNEVPRERR